MFPSQLVASLLLGVLDFHLFMQKGSKGIQGTPFEKIIFQKLFFEKLKFAVLKCHTNLGNAEVGVGGEGQYTKLAIIKKVEKIEKKLFTFFSEIKF